MCIYVGHRQSLINRLFPFLILPKWLVGMRIQLLLSFSTSAWKLWPLRDASSVLVWTVLSLTRKLVGLHELRGKSLKVHKFQLADFLAFQLRNGDGSPRHRILNGQVYSFGAGCSLCRWESMTAVSAGDGQDAEGLLYPHRERHSVHGTRKIMIPFLEHTGFLQEREIHREWWF